MHFEAESNGVKYQINVSETKKSWKVSIRPEEADWVHYDVPKEDYQHLDQTISFIFKDSSYLIDVVGSGTKYDVYTRGSYRTIDIYNEERLLHESLKSGGALGGGDSLTAGMPGKIVKVLVEDGEKVEEDEPLIIMEAMKMENEMRATQAATIKKVHVNEGENVEGGALLISFEK